MVFPIAKRTIIPAVGLFVRNAEGIENVPLEKGFILAANHCSYMDHMVLSSVVVPKLNKKLHFLAKKEHFDGWFQNKWHRWTGAIPIDRESGGKEALDEAVKLLKKGEIIGIYPEGTRSSTGKMQKGKTGVARLALAAKVPVLPVGIKGTFEMLPKGKLIPKLKRADINIGKLMYFDKYYGQGDNRDTLRDITNQIMKEIARLSGQEYNF